eukprot:jgi/Tetstr1/439442/TSEL_027876.t1
MLLKEQWEEARTAHADARTSVSPQLATNFAKTVIPAVNDKLRSNLTNYVLNEALKQPSGQQLRRNVAPSDRSFTAASVGWAADQRKDGSQAQQRQRRAAELLSKNSALLAYSVSSGESPAALRLRLMKELSGVPERAVPTSREPSRANSADTNPSVAGALRLEDAA